MRQLLIVLSTILFFCACNTPEYRINGTIEGVADGDTVELGYSNDGMDFIVTERSVIKDGKFAFHGKQDGCKIFYIKYDYRVDDTDVTPLYAMFFLEPGNINAEFTTESYRITGTATNDINTAIEDSLQSYFAQIITYQEALLQDSTMSEKQKAELENKSYMAMYDATTYTKSVVEKNIENMAGLFFLVRFIDIFDNSELSRLMAEVPEENKDADNNPLFEILYEVSQERNSSGAPDDYEMQELELEMNNMINDETVE